MSISEKELRDACFAFEAQHGLEAFCDAMARIMTERLNMRDMVPDDAPGSDGSGMERRTGEASKQTGDFSPKT